MRDQEIIGLWEAYQQVYAPQEITEEVEIAAQYFYEMGLNEDGVDILIEEVGVEEFAEFVYDIAEEYVLTEARAGGSRIEPVTAKGQKFKSGKPTGKSLERLRAQKAARREAETSASESKPSGMKASLQRQSAVAAAAKKQPKKPGFLDRVVGAVDAGIKRHNAAMNAARETGKVISKAAGKVGGVAREVGKGASGATKLAGHVARKGLEEEVEAWVNSLVEEGYDLSSYSWDDMVEIYLGEGAAEAVVKAADWVRKGKSRHDQAVAQQQEKKRQKKIPYAALTAEEVELAERKYGPDEELPSGNTPRKKMERQRGRHAANYLLRKRETKDRNDQAATSHFNRASTMDTVKAAQDRGEEPSKDPAWKNTIAARRRPRASYEVPNERPGGLRAGNTKAGGHRTLVRHEEFEGDLFDYLLEYLVAEGYADTNKAALAIMANMSEEWRESIVEAYKDLPVGKMIRQAGRKQFKHGMKVGYGDSPNPQVSQQIGKISAFASLHDPQAAQAKSKFKKD